LGALVGQAGGRWFAAQCLESFPARVLGCLSVRDAQALLDVRQERLELQPRDEPGLLFPWVSLAVRQPALRLLAVRLMPLAVLARAQEASWRALEAIPASQPAEPQPGHRLELKQGSSGQQALQLEWQTLEPTGSQERQVLRQAAPLAPREASLRLVLPGAGRALQQAACAPLWRPHPSLLFPL
jgi:hypothetical protein